MNSMTASGLGAQATEWLREVEDLRRKSSNIQGGVSGRMKARITKVIEAVVTLTTKAEASGDPAFLRMKNNELMLKLRKVERENSRLRDKMSGSGRAKSSASASGIETVTVTPDIGYLVTHKKKVAKDTNLGVPDRIKNVAHTFYALKPLSRRSPRKEIGHSVSLASNASMVMEDPEVKLSQQIASLVAQKRQLRDNKKKRRKMDVPPLPKNCNQNGAKSGVGVARTQDGSGGLIRRSLPRVVEDVMLVPSKTTALQGVDTPPVGSNTDGEWTPSPVGQKKRGGRKHPLLVPRLRLFRLFLLGPRLVDLRKLKGDPPDPR